MPYILFAKRDPGEMPLSPVGSMGDPVGNQHPLLGAWSLVDVAAEGARVPCALTVTPSLLTEGFVEKEKGKKSLLKACAHECFITHFSFDCKAAF